MTLHRQILMGSKYFLSSPTNLTFSSVICLNKLGFLKPYYLGILCICQIAKKKKKISFYLYFFRYLLFYGFFLHTFAHHSKQQSAKLVIRDFAWYLESCFCPQLASRARVLPQEIWQYVKCPNRHWSIWFQPKDMAWMCLQKPLTPSPSS